MGLKIEFVGAKKREIRRFEDYFKYLVSTFAMLNDFLTVTNRTIKKFVDIIREFVEKHKEYGLPLDFAINKLEEVNTIMEKFIGKTEDLIDEMKFLNDELSDTKKMNSLIEEFLKRKFSKIVDDYMMGFTEESSQPSFYEEGFEDKIEGGADLIPVPSAVIEKIEREKSGEKKSKKTRKKRAKSKRKARKK